MENTTPSSPQGASQGSGKKSSNNTVIIIVVIVVVLVVLGIIGSLVSGWIAKKFTEKGVESIVSQYTNGTVDIDTKNNTVTIESEDGTATIGSQELPDNFPSDIPVFPGATVLGSVTGSASDGSGIFVSLNSTDSMDDVKDFYGYRLSDNGWGEEQKTTIGNITNYSVMKGDRRLSISLTPYEDNQVHITITETTN